MNAVIFLGIVLMWAVVLVPMWLKRHEETEETRSVDKFSTAMHTLSRREASEKYVVMPRRNWLREVHVSGASAAQVGRATTAGTTAVRRMIANRSATRQAMSAAQRRRRTLTGLLVATFVTLLLAVAVGGVLLWTLQLVVDMCLVGFVAHLRIQARNAAIRRPASPRRPAPRYELARDVPQQSHDEVVEDDEFEPVAVQYAAPAGDAVFDQTAVAEVDDRALEPAAVGTESVFDQTAAAPASVPAAAADIAAPDPVPALDAADDDEIGSHPWEPVPVPRPTYTSKPLAPPRRRRAPTFEPVLPPESRPDHELDPVADLEEILDRRWAVND